MPLVLRHRGDLPPLDSFDCWLSLGTAPVALPDSKRVADLERTLERMFVSVIESWFDLARVMGRETSAIFAHTTSCTANSSDLGVMFAFAKMADEFAMSPAVTLAVCDDPWLFRHLQGRPGVVAGRKPSLWFAESRLRFRGLLARSRAAMRVAYSAVRLRHQRRRMSPSASYLLVYGHPGSTPEGYDGYFNDLMRRLPALKRMLHVDCDLNWASHLSRDGRTFSLHAFGNPFFALCLPFQKWKPQRVLRDGPHHWLIRRAAAREGGTGSGAMIAWQLHCQQRWLRSALPAVIAWPWENHGWERQFVRDARQYSVRTIGYQHATVGLQINQSPRSAPDGELCLPDEILCNGQSGLEQLEQLGIPSKKLTIGGALRTPKVSPPPYDASAPVFIASPFDAAIGRQIIEACRTSRDRKFVVKQHPMFPFDFKSDGTICETKMPLAEQPAVSAVIFAATTVGLEAWLGGLPTIRFLPEGRLALNILPLSLNVPCATAYDLAETLDRTRPHVPPTIEHFFAPVDLDVWRSRLGNLDYDPPVTDDQVTETTRSA